MPINKELLLWEEIEHLSYIMSSSYPKNLENNGWIDRNMTAILAENMPTNV